MRYGLDLLAGAVYPKVVTALAYKTPVIGAFATTFGPFLSTARRIAEFQAVTFRIQLLWSDTHSYASSSQVQEVRKLAMKYQTIAKNNPTAKIYLSPFCEHNLADPDKILDRLQDWAPDCIPVNNPHKGAFSKKYINEIHGLHRTPPGEVPYIYSWDGGLDKGDGTTPVEIVDCNIKAQMDRHRERALFYFLWHSRFNLKWSMKDKRSRPERLKNPRVPNVVFANSLLALTKDKEYETTLPLTPPNVWLVKSHAEAHEQISAKDDKLLIICPRNVKYVELIAGSMTARLKLYGSYEKGGYRYYSTKMGWEIAEAAREATGYPIVSLRVAGEVVGAFNPAFRGPTYR